LILKQNIYDFVLKNQLYINAQPNTHLNINITNQNYLFKILREYQNFKK